jgi:hypothetical protein
VRDFVFTPTHSFEEGLSTTGQKLQTGGEAISIVYPREYQWMPHDRRELPIWVDLTAALHPGHNVICVEIETSTNKPMFIASGEVQLANGEKIPIQSGANWVAEPVPPRSPQYSWIDPLVPVLDWHHAKAIPRGGRAWRILPDTAFRDAFSGKRIRSVVPNSVAWLEQDLDVAGRPSDGFLRVATDTPFQIWINGRPLRTANIPYGIYGYGPWFVRQRVPSPMESFIGSRPDLLDQNEVATLLPGQQPASTTSVAARMSTLTERPLNTNPLDSAPRANNYVSDQQPVDAGIPDRAQTQNSLPLTKVPQGGRPRVAGNPYASIVNRDRVAAPEFGRDRRLVEYVGYGITPLLHSGHNIVKVALYKDQPETVGLSRQAFFAFDGGYTSFDGHHGFASGEHTRLLLNNPNAGAPVSNQADNDGAIDPSTLPAMNYLGTVYPERPWFLSAIATFILTTVVLGLIVTRDSGVAHLLRRIRPSCAIVAGWIWIAILVRAAMMERSEALYWRFPITYAVILLVGLLGGLIPFLLARPVGVAKSDDGNPAGNDGSGKVLWSALLSFGLVLCFALRAWQIDLQPVDQDEAVSIQASLAVAHTGIPAFHPEVWYTRSPAFHYLTGLVARLTGDSIYGMRLLTVFFACVTGLLLWKATERFTGSRLWPFIALLLFDLHPYQIFTSHVVRFYQQQQFFHFLAVYLFIRGFVQNSGMRERYLAMLMFLLAVFSQETTVLSVIPLGICYLLFAQKRPWPDEIRTLVLSGCALALIVLDLAFFQLKCLTALDGVSARLDATIGWCFDKPTNFLAMFVGYSRLHLVPSFFLIPGFISAARKRQRHWLCLYTYFFISIVVVNLLITAKGFRYDYYLIVIWILLCIHGIKELSSYLIAGSQRVCPRWALSFGCVVAVLASWSPWRIPGSYEVNLQANPVAAMRFVAANIRPADKLAVTELHPQTGLLEVRKPDYDIAIPTYYDYVFRKQGKLIDRNAGAELIGNIDGLQQAFARHERLWIVCNREPDTIRFKDILWNYPAGRAELYLRQNARLMFRSYLWDVYLWDRNVGKYQGFREQIGNWFD